ncbi:hypothetical protein [Burkholderia ubonensis]|uniref:hypothetical protein n=1 Tax=Burkholderia ubonensis TaxID=101571 RepID=UPI00114D0A13|nr:hypothetical protein [Burkholderia ubonensis]
MNCAPSFPIDAHSLVMVGEVCRRLDGLPLALELAALRVATLGLEFLTNRLNDRLDLLTAGLRLALCGQPLTGAIRSWTLSRSGISGAWLSLQIRSASKTPTPWPVTVKRPQANSPSCSMN